MMGENKVISGLRDAIDWIKGDKSKGRVTVIDDEKVRAARSTRRCANCLISVWISPRFFNDEHWAAIIQKGSFFAIVDGNRAALATGYINRWHYGTLALAEESLAAWNGVGEPRRWFSKDIAKDDAMTVWP